MDNSDTFWMSRDEDAAGTLATTVDIWIARPSRKNIEGGGVMWCGDGITGFEGHFERWTPAQCLVEVHVYPETSRECIKYG